MAQGKENEKDGRMEDLDWKGGRAGVTPPSILPFFHLLLPTNIHLTMAG